MSGREACRLARYAGARLLLPLLLLLLVSCASQRGPASAVSASETTCVEPRPEVCTMDYRPVCARLASGEMRTYANACGACADREVLAHVAGACE